MEEEQGDDSEVLDAMDGWDSEEETGATSNAENNNDSDKAATTKEADNK